MSSSHTCTNIHQFQKFKRSTYASGLKWVDSLCIYVWSVKQLQIWMHSCCLGCTIQLIYLLNCICWSLHNNNEQISTVISRLWTATFFTHFGPSGLNNNINFYGLTCVILPQGKSCKLLQIHSKFQDDSVIEKRLTEKVHGEVILKRFNADTEGFLVCRFFFFFFLI